MSELDDAATRSWAAIRGLVLDYDRRGEVAAALGMSFLRVKALLALDSEPAMLRGLAATLFVDAPYATVMVDDLERRGLVTRTVHPDDRRARLVSLTDAGRAAVERANRLLSEPPPVLLALEPEQLRTLDQLLAGLRDPAPS